FEHKDPTVSISLSNDKAISLHVNPTFVKHPEVKVGLISNVFDPKKHTAVTFQENLDNKSKSKVRVNPLRIPKGHDIVLKVRKRMDIGCAKSKFITVFQEYNREHRPDLISLLDTRVGGDKVDLVIAKLGFQNSHHVEAFSFSSGVWIGWRDSISVEVLQSYPQFVLAKVTDSSFRWPFLVSF
ncbi:hypothetical protein Gotri_021019, partial [Gossypium trilobum]|nr:hypothetical protein [Gossypium trilobum]